MVCFVLQFKAHNFVFYLLTSEKTKVLIHFIGNIIMFDEKMSYIKYGLHTLHMFYWWICFIFIL